MLVVEEVALDSIADQAGIQPGDVLLRYAGQSLLSPFHLQVLEENTFSSQPLALELQRDGQAWSASVRTGKLGLRARPQMSEALLALCQQARKDQQAGRVKEAALRFEQAARQAATRENGVVSMVLFAEAGALYEQLRDWEQALQVYAEGRQAGASGDDPAGLLQLQLLSGDCNAKAQDYESAASCYKQAGALAERERYEMWLARCLSGLGHVAQDRGDLFSAQNCFQQALTICQKRAPGSLETAGSLNDLGNVAMDRGDLSFAEEVHLRALAIREKLAPGSLDVAYSLHNLGLVAWQRGDLSSAQAYHRRALAIREELDPGSLDLARSLGSLGHVAMQHGDLALAQDYHHRALAIREKLAPDSIEVAYSLHNLGHVARSSGDLTSAQNYYLHALEIRGRRSPGSIEVARSLNHLGMVAWQRGDLSVAQEYLLRALAIREELAPGSLDLVESLEQMGQVYLSQQQPERALPYLRQALEVVEKQRAAIQATDARALLLAKHAGIFPTLAQAHLALHQPHEAFSVLERLRARSLSELLAERQLPVSDAPQELLEEQRQLDQQQAQVYSALAKLSLTDQEQIEQLHARLHTLERQQQALTARIRATSPGYAALHYPQPLDARACQSVLDAGTLLLSFLIGEETGFLFAVTKDALCCYELPLGEKALQEKVPAFREALNVYVLENSLADAIEQGQQLYQGLLAPAKPVIDKARRLLLCLDGPLYFLPFAALVVKSGKKPVYLGQVKPMHATFSMTVYAQGRLAASSPQAQPHRQPAALRGKTGHTLEMRGQAAAGLWQVLAFGDPVYVPPSSENTHTRKESHASKTKRTGARYALAGLRCRGLSLDPLPYTREEVEAIASLFPEQAIVKIGAEATKTAAIKESEQADALHFACHGWLDPKLPLSSGLILSQPEALGNSEQDNGLLQAWEIFKLRLHADLVVLSACQTGLGTEIKGEGLIGLTRAFTYAGAKSVLVSLWEINDKSTAEFMTAFYQALKEGKSKDVALQQAIKKLSRHGKWRHPFFWSAFSLVGDWQ